VARAESWVSPVTGGWRDREITRITARQRTVASADQLYARGISKRAIESRLVSERLHIVFRGVYTTSPGELPPLALEQAALIACGEHSFISHHSAAFVWGLRELPPPQVEVSVVGRRSASRDGIRVHRIQKIPRAELRRHEGLWISSPARAVLEVAASATIAEVADIVNQGQALRRFRPRELEAVLRRNQGRRGVVRLAQALGDEDAMTITRSRAERAFLKLIRDARLPAPQTNQRLGRYEPDFMWREQRLIVELDSYRYHGGPGGFHNDHEKDFVYRDAGFDVLRPTRSHVIYEPARVLVSVVRALERSKSA
jgi:very-short-patch-repair endonuclease